MILPAPVVRAHERLHVGHCPRVLPLGPPLKIFYDIVPRKIFGSAPPRVTRGWRKA